MDIKSSDKLYWSWYEGKDLNYKGESTSFSESKSCGYNFLFEKNIFFENKCKVKPSKFNA